MSISNIRLHRVVKKPIESYSAQSPTIIFIHGNSTSSCVWGNQLNDNAFKDYHMVAFDMPGHGKSPRLEKYSFKKLVEVLVENCKQFERVILVGHSLGGHLAIESLSYLDNCIGCLICGAPPVKKPINLEEAILANEKMGYFFQEKLWKNQVAEMAKLLAGRNMDWIRSLKTAINSTDSKYRPAVAKSISTGEFSDEYKILQKSELPIAIFHGENDSLVNLEYLNSLRIAQLWKGKVIEIPSCGHSSQIENSKLFNQLFLEFLNDITE